MRGIINTVDLRVIIYYVRLPALHTADPIRTKNRHSDRGLEILREHNNNIFCAAVYTVDRLSFKCCDVNFKFSGDFEAVSKKIKHSLLNAIVMNYEVT